MAEAAIKVGQVCVVIENGDYLYGVFTNEASARADYGELSDGYIPDFITCPVYEVVGR